MGLSPYIKRARHYKPLQASCFSSLPGLACTGGGIAGLGVLIIAVYDLLQRYSTLTTRPERAGPAGTRLIVPHVACGPSLALLYLGEAASAEAYRRFSRAPSCAFALGSPAAQAHPRRPDRGRTDATHSLVLQCRGAEVGPALLLSSMSVFEIDRSAIPSRARIAWLGGPFAASR